MRVPGGNHVDRRRKLLPRDYLSDPHRFGRSLDVRIVVPPGGDGLSAVIACVQHMFVWHWIEVARRHPRSGEIHAVFGLSRQTWNRITLGQRWAGETGFVTLLCCWVYAPRRTPPTGRRKPRP